MNIQRLKQLFDDLMIREHDTIFEICNLFKLEELEAGKIVFQQQHQAKHLYYTLSGGISILKNEGYPESLLSKVEIQVLKDFRFRYHNELTSNPYTLDYIKKLDIQEGLMEMKLSEKQLTDRTLSILSKGLIKKLFGKRLSLRSNSFDNSRIGERD